MREAQEQVRSAKPRVVFYIFSGIIIALLALTLLTVAMTKQTGAPIMVGGYGMMLVDGSQMGQTIPKQSAIVIQQVGISALKADDVIVVRDYNEKHSEMTVTTRISALNPTEEGLTFITRGDISDVDDSRLRTENDIYGKVVMVIPVLGKFLSFVKSPIGLATCVALPLALMLIIEIINLFRMSKSSEREEEPGAPQMFGTRNPGNKARVLGAPEYARTDVALEAPVDAESVKRNLAEKVRSLKNSGMLATPFDRSSLPVMADESENEDEFTKYQPTRLFQNASKSVGNADAVSLPKFEEFDDYGDTEYDPEKDQEMGFDEDDEDESTMRIYTKNEEFAQEALVNIRNHNYKIEPLNERDIRITPHKITTIADEEKETFSQKIVTLRDELMQDNEVLENMGGFNFDHPIDLWQDAEGAAQNKGIFSRNSAKLALRRDERAEFTTTVEHSGRDRFNIEGIDVRVRSDALRLNLDDPLNGRDIVITVKDDVTSVVVDGDEYQVNFAMYKDIEDEEQKVVIQKKNRR